MSRFIGASMTKGAVSAPQRKPATKVCVFQCPKGALETSRRPLRLRPRRRVILVVVPVSSRKTSRCGSSRIFGWRTLVHSSRACLTSRRSCSLARRVFFESVAGANKPTRKRGGIGLLAGRGGELGRQFRHRDVGPLGDLRQQKRPVRIELGVAPAAAGLGRQAPSPTKGRHQVHHKGDRHLEMRRGGATRMTFLDKAHNPLTQIKRIGPRHRKSPPNGSESQNTPHRNPSRFNLRIRRSRRKLRKFGKVWGADTECPKRVNLDRTGLSG